MGNLSFRNSISLIICGLATSNALFGIDFDAAMQRVTENSLQLRSAELKLGISDAEKEQAMYWDNPQLSVEGSDIGSHRPEIGVFVTQQIELGGKRSARDRFTSMAKCAAFWDYVIVRCDLENKLMHAFINAAAAQEKLKIAEEQRKVSEQTLSAVSSKVDAGKASPIEHKKAQVVFNTNQRAYAKAETALQSAKKKVSALWESYCADFDTVEYPFYTIQQPASFEELASALNYTSDFNKQHVGVALTCEALSLEKAKRIPDVAVGAGVTGGGDDSDRGLFVGIEVPIPLFDQNGGNIRKARLEKEQAQCQQYEHMNAAMGHLHVLYAELITAYNDASSLRDSGLPAAKEALEGAQHGYKEGKFEYLEMLDSHKTYYEIKGAYIDALAEYHHHLADIIRLTAGCE